MVQELGPDARAPLAPFFAAYPCLRGLAAAIVHGGMGTAYVDRVDTPTAAVAVLDFSLFAGDATTAGAAALAGLLTSGATVVAPTPAWRALIAATYPGEMQDYPREAFRVGRFNRARLERFRAQLPEGYTLVRVTPEQVAQYADDMDESLSEWFGSDRAFNERGVAFAVQNAGRFVAGCSSGAAGGGALEFQVDTHPDHRRRGLARVVSAALLLYCLDHGIEPCWDAANPMSSALARQLGFEPTLQYVAYRLE